MPPGSGHIWEAPAPSRGEDSGSAPSGGDAWQAPPPSASADWGASEPDWAPPPPPAPSRQPGQAGWAPAAVQPWGGQQQTAWGQPSGYGAAPAYGAVATAPAPTRRTRLWVILGVVAAVVAVVLVVGAIGVYRLLGPKAVPPATGATVSTPFVQLKLASTWKETHSRSSELEISNHGDGDMLIGYGNSSQDGISSNQSAFQNLQQNLTFNTGGPVRQCAPQQGVTVGGKSGEEEGFRYTFQGTDLCEIAWVDYVSSSRYYYWNIGDDYSKLSVLQHDDAAMQETASWKV